MTINAYPLQWPAGWRRIAAEDRRDANFKRYGRPLTVHEGKQRVLREIERLGLTRDDVVLSTNIPLRMDGEMRADAKAPVDPGAAVYWQEQLGARRVMAVDRYTAVEDNLAAVAATLEAMRAIERHGGAVILERAFTGFVALPAPGGSASTRHWREVLGFATGSPSRDVLRERYRSRMSSAHPDKGGTTAEAAELNLAFEQAEQELGLS